VRKIVMKRKKEGITWLLVSRLEGRGELEVVVVEGFECSGSAGWFLKNLCYASGF
jgi:hypothetical protein